MPIPPENIDVDSTEDPGKSHIERATGTLSANLLAQYLTDKDLASLRVASTTTKQLTDYAVNNETLEKLLSAVVLGEQETARKILTSRPELILDSSATVKDISGREIKGLTPLQAAICACDVEMMEMIKKVMEYKLPAGISLNSKSDIKLQRQITNIFKTLDSGPDIDAQKQLEEIYNNLSVESDNIFKKQFTEIYPQGIDAKETEQMAIAQEFKSSALSNIFDAINAEAVALVSFELDNPGQYSDSNLNAALHNFRTQFAKSANSEQIFNTFYLLAAFEFYNEQFDNFAGDEQEKSQRRLLFCIQIIGFIQRYLPACFLQTFERVLDEQVLNRKKLERQFKFKYSEGYMRAIAGDVNNLGYVYWYSAELRRNHMFPLRAIDSIKTYCKNQSQILRSYLPPRPSRSGPVA